MFDCELVIFDVIPAKAGIHLDLLLIVQEQNGFPLSRE
jgi:hypothetical protein